MKGRQLFVGVLTILLTLSFSTMAQNEDLRFEFGAGGGIALGLTESEDDQIQPYGRAFFGSSWVNNIQTEIGLGFGLNGDDNYETRLIPIDVRLKFSPIVSDLWIPYVYTGLGALYYEVDTVPPDVSQTHDWNGWTAHIPYGVGVQYRTGDFLALELCGGGNYTFTDEINPVISEDDDGFLAAFLGLRYTIGGRITDSDGDGLTNKIEKQLGTDRKNPDTDGDGLTDGDEVSTYMTNPLKGDSDGDGLGDLDEINVHKTDPNKKDSDKDGLDDGAEITKYVTDPLKPDTDKDGLTDYDEVMTYMTDPKADDTDADGLSDSQEIQLHKTDPLKVDTDNGSIDDLAEINRGTDPFNAEDDIPAEEMLTIKESEHIVLEGVVFNSGSADLLLESEEILMKAYNTLKVYPEIKIEIRGYTDNTGSRAFNMKLSQKRADAIRDWLINKGIAPERLTAKGLGPDNPIAPNDTKEGRQQNRRIEFVRIK